MDFVINASYEICKVAAAGWVATKATEQAINRIPENYRQSIKVGATGVVGAYAGFMADDPIVALATGVLAGGAFWGAASYFSDYVKPIVSKSVGLATGAFVASTLVPVSFFGGWGTSTLPNGQRVVPLPPTSSAQPDSGPIFNIG